MDLKKIFKHDEHRLLQYGANTHQAYGRHKERFEGFEKCLREPFRQGFPQGAFAFLPLAVGEANLFRVSFCGMEIVFCFDMVEGEKYAGAVTCTARSVHKQFEPVEVGHFLFNEGGYMAFDPDGRGALRIDEWDSANGIFVAFILAALSVERSISKKV